MSCFSCLKPSAVRSVRPLISMANDAQDASRTRTSAFSLVEFEELVSVALDINSDRFPDGTLALTFNPECPFPSHKNDNKVLSFSYLFLFFDPRRIPGASFSPRPHASSTRQHRFRPCELRSRARMCAKLQFLWSAKTRLSPNHNAHGAGTILTFQVASCPQQNQTGSQRICRANADPVNPCETGYHPWSQPSAAATHPNYSQPTQPKLPAHPHRIHLSRLQE